MTLSRSIARTFAYFSSGKSAIGDTNCTPALFTRLSSPPSSCAARSTVARIAAGSRTSHAYARAETPYCAAIALAVPDATSASRSTTATAEPACASASAHPRPLPPAPPVTKLTRSRRSIASKVEVPPREGDRFVGTLVLSGVARSFGDVVAVRDVSFTVPAGTTFGLLGPNGAGKTTTMRMILGILLPDRGSVTWDGAPVDLAVRRRFGYLPEERGVYGKLKVREQIAYFGRLHGVMTPNDTKRADAWIERLGLGVYAKRPRAEPIRRPLGPGAARVAGAVLRARSRQRRDAARRAPDAAASRHDADPLVASDVADRGPVQGVLRHRRRHRARERDAPGAAQRVADAHRRDRAAGRCAARRARRDRGRAPAARSGPARPRLRDPRRRRYRGAAAAARRGRRRHAVRARSSEPARHLPARDRSGGVNTVGVIFSAEFLRRIKSKAFLVGTIIGAASILLIAILPSILGGALSSSSKKIVLVGDPALTATAKTLLQRDFEITATLRKLDAAPTPAFLDAHGKASAVAILSRPVGDGLHVVAYARDPSAFRESFGTDLAPLQIALATGVPVERVAAHLNVTVDVHDVSGRFADASSADAAKGVAYEI